MTKASVPPPSDPNSNPNNCFQSLTDVTAKLSQGRGDNVAIVGIIGLVLAFMTMIVIAGFVYTDSNRQGNPMPQSSSTETLSNQPDK